MAASFCDSVSICGFFRFPCAQLHGDNTPVLIPVLSFALFLLWLLLAGAGIGLWRTGGRLLGAALLVFGALALATQLALSLIPVGIGEPLIRIDTRALFGGLALAVLTAAAVLFALRPRFAPNRRAAPIATLLTPLLAGAALWGLAYASTPLRERERNASRRQVVLPAGFKAEIYANAESAGGTLDNPTVITFGPDGELYLADIAGNLWMGRDANHDNRIDALKKIGEGYQLLVGLAKRGNELYVSSAGKIEALRDTNSDGIPESRRTLADKLPSMILQPHSNNSLTFGPDGRLYFGVGGTVQRGPEPQALAGAILSVSPDGGDVKVFARGFDNTFDLAFTSTGAMFAGDNATTPAGEKSGKRRIQPDHRGWRLQRGRSDVERPPADRSVRRAQHANRHDDLHWARLPAAVF